jgi:hypothetical protein
MRFLLGCTAPFWTVKATDLMPELNHNRYDESRLPLSFNSFFPLGAVRRSRLFQRHEKERKPSQKTS